MITGALKIAIRFLMIFFVLISFDSIASDEIRKKIHNAELEHDIPTGLLLAIAKIETGLKNWAMNIDGISVFAKDEAQAIQVLKTVASSHRYGVQGRNNGVLFAGFYKTEYEAKAKSRDLERKNQLIKVKNNYYTKINPIYTDVCVMQINYRYHGPEHFKNINEMFDVDKCIHYAASYLSKLIKKHGIKAGVGCYNGCSNESKKQGSTDRYIKKVFEHWDNTSTSYGML